MTFKSTVLAGALAMIPTLGAAHMVIEDPYVRVSSPMAQSGAAFMSIFNHHDVDDRLIGVSSDVSERLEIHTHVQDANGVMRMVEIEDGIELPAGEIVMLERGGLHVMFLGLREELVHGEQVEMTFTFESSPPLTVMVPVDLERQPGHGTMGATHNHRNDS